MKVLQGLCLGLGAAAAVFSAGAFSGCGSSNNGGGSGTSSGSGSGVTSGSGSGSTSGTGSGVSTGSGSGTTSGTASGATSGTGSGSTSGAASGTGSGSMSGAASGTGSGSMSGATSGVTSGATSGTILDSGLKDTGLPDTGILDTGVPESGVSAKCNTYCAAIHMACTTTTTSDAGAAPDQQYASDHTCQTACSFMTEGMTSDTSGNTVGCRTTHAGYAVQTPVPHCWHAGPLGYSACGMTSDAGAQAGCQAFCQIDVGYCGAGDAGTTPYKSMDDCMTACGTWPALVAPGLAGSYNSLGTGIMSGNTLECRMYYLELALQDHNAMATNCPDTAAVSSKCH